MDNNEKELKKSSKKKVSKKIIYLAILIGVVVLCSGSKMVYESLCHETTDDAQVDGNIIPLRTTVTGYISQIRFTDNQQVKMGDTLVIYDTTSLKAQVMQAQAQILAAQAELQSCKKQVSASEFSEIAAGYNSGSAKENIAMAKAKEWQAQKEYQRIEKMNRDGAATQQTLDNTKATYQVAAAQLAAAQKQFDASNAEKSTTRSQTSVHSTQVSQAIAHIKQAQAQLALAQDQYKHAFIIAPCNGIVSKKSIENGQFVPSGTALASIINLSDIWVTANFKETQLNKMKPGQSATVEIDAYPGLKLEGKVESFCGAAGNKFSILPAENATGNFIKVTQRIPVRIHISNNNEKALLPGMNANVSVKIK